GVWTTLIFVMNALVFILIGLELPEIIAGLGKYSIEEAIKYGLIISFITIILRFIWVYISTHISRWLSPKARKEPAPGWKGLLILSWSGMRGVVSLATALSIPMMMTDNTTAFPQRNLIIFITFVVIFITLVVQGLSLPYLLKIIKIKEVDHIIPSDRQQLDIQLRLDNLALSIINDKYENKINENHLVKLFKANIENTVENSVEGLNSLKAKEAKHNNVLEFHQILLDIYGLQRKELFKFRKENSFSDEEIRKSELQLDLNELKITSRED
ncbi:MAG: cation:proton antiporter, partial [Algoriella sp.]